METTIHTINASQYITIIYEFTRVPETGMWKARAIRKMGNRFDSFETSRSYNMQTIENTGTIDKAMTDEWFNSMFERINAINQAWTDLFNEFKGII